MSVERIVIGSLRLLDVDWGFGKVLVWLERRIVGRGEEGGEG